MFAQSFFDFGLSEGVLFFVRIIITVVGAVVGWFVADPLTRITYRLSFKGTTPTAVLFSSKAAGAATLAALIWFFLPLGGGGGGLGWGPGLGGGPGKGPGEGGNKGDGTDPKGKDTKGANDPKNNTTPKTDPEREPLKIEILGGELFTGEDRYFLLKLKGSASTRSLAEVEDYIKQHRPSLIEIIHTDDTALDNTEGSPTARLQKLANKHDIPHKGPK